MALLFFHIFLDDVLICSYTYQKTACDIKNNVAAKMENALLRIHARSMNAIC